MSDLVDKQKVLSLPRLTHKTLSGDIVAEYISVADIEALPSAQPQTCEGCKHLGKWENEVEYGYPSPCTRCKRRVEDHYER